MRWAIHVAIVLIGALWILPLYVLIVGSLKPLSEVLTMPVYLPPSSFSFDTIARVAVELAPVVLNTAIIVIPTALGTALIGALGAYTLWRSTSRLKDVFLVIVAIATYIPYQSAVVPLARFMNQIGLFDTLYGISLGLAIFYIPFATLMMLIFITALPRSVVEAAEVDGAGEFTIFRKAVLPLLGPAYTSTATYLAINGWNNFFIPLVLSKSYYAYYSKGFQLRGAVRQFVQRDVFSGANSLVAPLVVIYSSRQIFHKGSTGVGIGREVNRGPPPTGRIPSVPPVLFLE